MPDSMGKRKRRDVTARKHAAREERRVARAGRKKDREAGIIEPGPPIGPAEQMEPEVDGEDGEAQVSEQKPSEPKPVASRAPAPKPAESAGAGAKDEAKA
jgi:hypothetical protein